MATCSVYPPQTSPSRNLSAGVLPLYMRKIACDGGGERVLRSSPALHGGGARRGGEPAGGAGAAAAAADAQPHPDSGGGAQAQAARGGDP
eukprot:5190766-Pyramimonas_sp.AAC.1